MQTRYDITRSYQLHLDAVAQDRHLENWLEESFSDLPFTWNQKSLQRISLRDLWIDCCRPNHHWKTRKQHYRFTGNLRLHLVNSWMTDWRQYDLIEWSGVIWGRNGPGEMGTPKASWAASIQGDTGHDPTADQTSLCLESQHCPWRVLGSSTGIGRQFVDSWMLLNCPWANISTVHFEAAAHARKLYHLGFLVA